MTEQLSLSLSMVLNIYNTGYTSQHFPTVKKKKKKKKKNSRGRYGDILFEKTMAMGGGALL